MITCYHIFFLLKTFFYRIVCITLTFVTQIISKQDVVSRKTYVGSTFCSVLNLDTVTPGVLMLPSNKHTEILQAAICLICLSAVKVEVYQK
jgi:hypothetical protein